MSELGFVLLPELIYRAFVDNDLCHNQDPDKMPKATRLYADNPYNRSLGRVGKPVGSAVVSRRKPDAAAGGSGQASTSKEADAGDKDNISPYTYHPGEKRRVRTLAEMCASAVMKAAFPSEGWCLRPINSYQHEEFIEGLYLDKAVIPHKKR